MSTEHKAAISAGHKRRRGTKFAGATVAAARPDACSKAPKRPLTFEEQLALVMSGKAKVVAKVPIRRPDPDMTLGGVGSAML